MDKARISRRTLIGTTTAAGLAASASIFTPMASSARAQGGVATPGATPDVLGDAIPEEFQTETNWPAENYDLAGTRDVRGTNISSKTIGELGQAWSYPVTTSAAFGNLTGNPAVVGDKIFIQDATANVYALNKETGEELWSNKYDDIVPSGGPNGVAAAYGLIFTTIGGVGDVIALKSDTGEEVWRTNILGSRQEGITVVPAIRDNKVWVSTIPGSSTGFYQSGQRGVMHVLDAATGEVLWYFDTTTDNLWGHPTVNSGGGSWHPPAFDGEGKAYVPVANPGPYPGTEEWPWASSRPGENLYTNSLLKMDPDTAVLDWYTQVKPHDVFDLDNHLVMVADVDGAEVAFTTGKHGVVYALDSGTGEILWRVPVGTHKNDERTEFEEDETVEVWPGTLGGVETPFAWSDEHNVIVFPVVELPTTYTSSSLNADALFSGKGLLIALNPSDGSVVWETELSSAPYAAATICNDVVFSAGLDGLILGFSLEDGSELFRYQASAGINAQAAVSGDYIYFPAGGPLVPSDEATNQPEKAESGVLALKLGGEKQEQATPQATPAE